MKIVQLTNRTGAQMMGFFVVTETGRIVAIDGGMTGDTDGFCNRLDALCREIGREPSIDFWFLTHPHMDHHDVFLELSRHPRPIRVGTVYYSPLPDSFAQNESWCADNLLGLNAEMRVTPFHVEIFQKGVIEIDKTLCVEVLCTADPTLTVNAFNNASCVLRFTEKRPGQADFVWLVLGDLGIEAGRRLLESVPEKLRVDAVQMAHHGQNGVEESFYQAVRPRYAFWTTPDWLWTNTPPGAETPGCGPWKTLVVRAWMEKLGAVAIRPTGKDLLFRTEDESVHELD